MNKILGYFSDNPFRVLWLVLIIFLLSLLSFILMNQINIGFKDLVANKVCIENGYGYGEYSWTFGSFAYCYNNSRDILNIKGKLKLFKEDLK